MAAAMVGGTAYVAAKAGQNAAMNEADEQAPEDDQSAPSTQPEAQQQAQQAPAAPAPAESDLASKLVELKNLNDQGVLTDDEFTAAKQKLIDES